MSTDPTSLIGKFTQLVHQLRVRPLVWLKDDPMGPDGTGQLVVRRGDQQHHNSSMVVGGITFSSPAVTNW